MTPRIHLRHLDFRHVTYHVRLTDGHVRVCDVLVGTGAHGWHKAVRFPHNRTEDGLSTGDAQLDTTIREMAAEELVRLAAARAA